VIFKKYIEELNRRHVFKAGIAYLVVAWLIAQVASIVLPTFIAPPYLMKSLLFILAIGFPVNLIFAWIYDITPEGIKKTDEIDRGKPKSTLSSQRFNKVIIVSLSFIVMLLLFNQFRKTPTNNSENVANTEDAVSIAPLLKSIAVLPFQNWSGNDSLEYFVDGMTDEVITRLTKVSGLDKVISRTSVFKFKETTKSIPEIAEELAVSHILESSFQKVGNQFKIKYSLIEVSTENSVWSDELTGEWKTNDVFDLQSTVSENVVKNMNVKLSAEEIVSLAQKPTENDEAYNLFLQAEFQKNKNDNQSYKNAIPLYEAAIALDENFVLAYLGLADIWLTGGLIWGLFSEREAAQISQKLLEKVLKIDPDNIIAFKHLFGTKFYYYWDFEFCEKNREKLIRRLPKFPETNLSGDYLTKTGRHKQAITWCDRWITQFPTLSFLYGHKAKALLLAGQDEQALSLLRSNDPLYQNNQFYLREICWVYLNLGQYQKFKEKRDLLQSQFSDRSAVHIWYEAIEKEIDKKDADAAGLVAELKRLYEEKKSGSPAWFISLYYFYVEDIDEGFRWLQRSFDRHEVEMTWLREEPMLRPYRDHPVYKKLYEQMNWPELR
jgi:TolB-like protein/tetratricopeptide (TPR) repeat protein